MRLPNRYRRLDGLLLGLVTALLIAAAPQAKAEPGPFAALAGSWSGGGEVNMSDGSVDRLRCKATYSVGGGGATATLNLRCASDSYNFDLTGNVRSQGGTVSGTWTEATRGIGGTVSGTSAPNGISLQVIGPTFAAGLALSVNGNKQAISISAPASEIRSASISLTKS
jgi:hypothetical protein